MSEIKVPTLGESVTTATVARWLKQAGEAVAADEPVVELETDKVTVEVNAPSAGVMEQPSAKEGDEVQVGTVLGTIGENSACGAPPGRCRHPPLPPLPAHTSRTPTPPPVKLDPQPIGPWCQHDRRPPAGPCRAAGVMPRCRPQTR